jgi:hypothetical protein
MANNQRRRLQISKRMKATKILEKTRKEEKDKCGRQNRLPMCDGG